MQSALQKSSKLLCSTFGKFNYYGLSEGTYNFHKTAVNKYRIKAFPLPSSVEVIEALERASFSPLRQRDINGSRLAGDVTRLYADLRVRSYDSTGNVSLSAHMQSNVPSPCQSQELYTHFNLPGGLWGQCDKYLAEDHIIATARSTFLSPYSTGWCQGRHFSTNPPLPDKPNYEGLTRAQKLKTAVKEYGSVVIVFHVGISLLSLGACYLIVTSGVDFSSIFSSWTANEGGAAAATAAPFVVAYAIHKTMAPIRITITLVSVPLIVRYLRRIGFMKPPKPPSNLGV